MQFPLGNRLKGVGDSFYKQRKNSLTAFLRFMKFAKMFVSAFLIENQAQLSNGLGQFYRERCYVLLHFAEF